MVFNSPEAVIVLATGSKERKKRMEDRIDTTIGKECLKGLHTVDPEKDCGVPESTRPKADEVAIDKGSVVSAASGVFPVPEDAPWRDVVRDVLIPDVEGCANVYFLSSDVVTKIGETMDVVLDPDSPEIFRIYRKLTGLSKREQKRKIAEDKHESKERYLKQEYFVVHYKVAIALLKPNGKTHLVYCEIVARVHKPSKNLLQKAYKENGSAGYSAPRLDITKMIEDGYATSVLIRNVGGDVWYDLDAFVLSDLVRGGILPARSFIEFLNLSENFEGQMLIDWNLAEKNNNNGVK